MRKHGWQLPYHPLQVVAIAVFLALGFAFYVFFLPFVGRKVFEYVVMGLYTPLVACVFGLYVWCAATDPGDPGIFKSKKYLNAAGSRKQSDLNLKQGSSIHEGSVWEISGKSLDEHPDSIKLSDQLQKEKSSGCSIPLLAIFLAWCPLSYVTCCFNTHEQSSEQQKSEDGMFYCSLCEVEKHCQSTTSPPGPAENSPQHLGAADPVFQIPGTSELPWASSSSGRPFFLASTSAEIPLYLQEVADLIIPCIQVLPPSLQPPEHHPGSSDHVYLLPYLWPIFFYQKLQPRLPLVLVETVTLYLHSNTNCSLLSTSWI